MVTLQQCHHNFIQNKKGSVAMCDWKNSSLGVSSPDHHVNEIGDTFKPCGTQKHYIDNFSNHRNVSKSEILVIIFQNYHNIWKRETLYCFYTLWLNIQVQDFCKLKSD